jgi:tetratricopeptide (TPR) repeat protein
VIHGVIKGARQRADDSPATACISAATDQAVVRSAELSEAGAHEAALAVLDRAIAVDSQSAALHAARGWALENLEPAHLTLARSAYEAAIVLDADDLWSQLGLATVVERLGSAEAGRPTYLELVAKASMRTAGEPDLLELLGWCQYCLGRLEDARATFGRALAIDDRWVSVHFDLGLVALLRCDTAGAIDHFGDGLSALATRDPRRRAGPLKVAIDDLEHAMRTRPLKRVKSTAISIRAWLSQAVGVQGDGHG